MEELLLSALLQDRQAYIVAVRIGLDANDFSEAGKMIVKCAVEQYKRDAEQKAVSIDVLRTQFERKVKNKDMAQSYMDYVERLPTDYSRLNIADEYRLLRRQRVATQLATRLATGQHDEETDALVSKYLDLNTESSDGAKYRLTGDDFDENNLQRIPIYPASLNRYIGGGVLRGHNITVYGRPDSGKSLFAINQAAMACSKGFKVLYVANEEPPQDISRRLLARICGRHIGSLRSGEQVRSAIDQVGEAYGQRWNLLHRAGCSVKDIRAAAGDVHPDIIIVDQLKNIRAAEDNRALQLDKLAREVRELGIEHTAVTISVTQAGGSGADKLVLDMGDIEWSNTGIPGASDLLIGIGVNDEYELAGKRMLSLPKNKVNGRHGSFPVWVDIHRTAFRSKPK